jgi:hypothetical protein
MPSVSRLGASADTRTRGVELSAEPARGSSTPLGILDTHDDRRVSRRILESIVKVWWGRTRSEATAVGVTATAEGVGEGSAASETRL